MFKKLLNLIWSGRTFGSKRSSKWRYVRKQHIVLNPSCAVCLKKGRFVHHIFPFHKFPLRELDEDNLITLCRVHHFWFGHLGSWHSWNENILKDAKEWSERISKRP